MEVSLCTSSVGFDALKDEWNEAVLASESANPFLSHNWLSNWWRFFGGDKELAIVLVRENGLLVGGMACYVARVRIPVACRVLRLCGDTDVSSEFLGPLARHGYERVVVQSVTDFLHGDAVLWDVFHAADMDQDAGAALQLLAVWGGLYERRQLVEFNDNLCMYIDLPKRWEEYWDELGKRKKRTFSRLDRRLQEEGEVTFCTAKEVDPAGLGFEAAWKLYGEVMLSTGRKNSESLNKQSQFLETFWRESILSGWADATFILLQGRPVAFLYYLTNGKSYFLYKTGYDFELSRFSVGASVFLQTIRQGIEAGMERVEFLRGGHDYKRSLRITGERALVDAVYVKPSLPGRAYLVRRLAAKQYRAAKQFAKRILPEKVVSFLKSPDR